MGSHVSEGDDARHRAARERRRVGSTSVAVLAVVAMAIGAGATYAVVDDDGADVAAACPGPSISVAAAPEIAPTVRAA